MGALTHRPPQEEAQSIPMATTAASPKKRETLDQAVIRFCGDSGDGMQITGSQFTNTVALYGNDLATFPDYPAEIRAPAGTLPGVSGFQLHFSSSDVYTPGDSVDVLIAMNPAALQDEPGGPEAQRHPRREHRQLQGTGPEEGADDREPPRGPFPRRLPAVRRGAHQAHSRRPQGPGPRLQEHGPLQELLRPGHVLLALQPADGRHVQVARREVPEQAAPRRGQQAGDEGRVLLLRGHRSVPDELRDSARQAVSRHVSQHQRQHRPGAGIRRGFPASRDFRCSRARTPSLRLPTFSTSCRCTRSSA